MSHEVIDRTFLVDGQVSDAMRQSAMLQIATTGGRVAEHPLGNVEVLLSLEVQEQAAIRSGGIEIRHLSGSCVSYRFASVILLSASQSAADQRNGAVTDNEDSRDTGAVDCDGH
jgi:hypothetical protein